MAFTFVHVHIKTSDVKKTAQYYIDNFAATVIGDIPGRGIRLDLHGLQLNVTTKIDVQTHAQEYGFEHMSVETDDFDGLLATLAKNGVRVVENMPSNNGRHVAWAEAPEGTLMEFIEKE